MKISDLIKKSIQAKIDLLDFKQIKAIESAGTELTDSFARGNKILIAGNGGSAGDAQHFAAELAGRFIYERKSLPAIALTANSSIVTAIGNDFGFEDLFVRQLEALAKPGDIFFAISTSGNSANIIKALRWAKENGIKTVGLLGRGGGEAQNYCDLSVIVPSGDTQNIQEAHIMIIHLICQMVDEAFRE
jgi:D-sedoheptulose 7-phosphate isomerase